MFVKLADWYHYMTLVSYLNSTNSRLISFNLNNLPRLEAYTKNIYMSGLRNFQSNWIFSCHVWFYNPNRSCRWVTPFFEECCLCLVLSKSQKHLLLFYFASHLKQTQFFHELKMKGFVVQTLFNFFLFIKCIAGCFVELIVIFQSY